MEFVILISLAFAIFAGVCFYAARRPHVGPVSGDAVDMLGQLSLVAAVIFGALGPLSGCEWLDTATSAAMQQEFRNGAIVRAEMRARGVVPWWP